MIDRSEKPDRGSDEEREGAFRCGSIAIIGRANVGKSTLLHAPGGGRGSITSGKTQTEADPRLRNLVRASGPLLLVVNKIDRTPRERLLPFLQETVRQAPFAEIVPVSAERRRGLKELLRTVRKYLPEQAPMFGEDEITDRDERFLAAELIREKLFRLMGDRRASV